MQIFIAGDSTASIKLENKRPETGWGEMIHFYLSEDVKIINKAQNGRSTKSFLMEERLLEIEPLFKKGDYLFIQFGHNDSKKESIERYASPIEYKKNLKVFVDTARSKGVIPIIFSSVSRRNFLKDNKTIDLYAVGKYPSYAREVSKKEEVIFVDMFSKTKELYEYLGYEMSKKLFLKFKPNIHPNYLKGVDDNTHFNYLGAKVIASLVAEELSKINSPIKIKVLKDKLLSFEEIKTLILKTK